jgi:Xaa-Pro dipeptidase
MDDQLISLPFRLEEYVERLSRTRESMIQRGLDLLVLTVPASVNYLTGFETGTASSNMVLLLPTEGDAVLVVRKTELSNAEALATQSWIKATRGVDDSEDYAEALASVISRFRSPNGQIGIEQNGIFFTIASFRELAERFPQVAWLGADDIVSTLRATKSQAELVYMRKAGQIAASAMEEGIGSIREGMVDRELAVNLFSAAVRRGSGPMPNGPLVTTGTRTFLAHSNWVGRTVERGDLVNTELAANVNHYNATVFRVSVVGQPSSEIERFHDASFQGLIAGLDRIGPGLTSHEADQIVRERITQLGYGEYFVVRAAYGLGLGFPPSWSDSSMQIRPGDPRKLEEGMCFHLVPALYKRGLGAVCCSMSIEITAEGCRLLTPIEPKLFVV